MRICSIPTHSSPRHKNMGNNAMGNIAYANKYFWTLLIFTIVKVLDVVLSLFGLIWIALPLSAFASKDNEDEKKKPKVLKFEEFKLKFYSLVHVVFNIDISYALVEKCYAKMINANQFVPDALTQAIPTIDAAAQDFSAQDFFTNYIKRPHPVVLKGFAKNTEAVQKWTLDYLVEKFGDDDVLLKTPEADNVKGKLKDLNVPGNYLHNCESLFLNHPELTKALEVEKLKVLTGGDTIANDHPNLGPLPLQLFTGRGGTGTAFHCANAYNFFFQVSGEKKWTFVDPRWTMFMFPALNRGAVYQSCAIKDPNTVLEQYKPLWRVCPRYAAVLEPGDVLLNPPWWWHCIENLSESSVAVATRWADTKALNPITGIGSGGNRLFTAFQLFSPPFVKMSFNMVLTNSRIVPDEHTNTEATRRSRQGSRFEQTNRMIDAFNSNKENDAYKAYYASKRSKSSDHSDSAV